MKTALEHNLDDRIKELHRNIQAVLREYMTLNHGVSRSTYYRFLRGGEVTIKVATALAKGLGCNLDQLLNPNHKFQNAAVAKALKPQISQNRALMALLGSF